MEKGKIQKLISSFKKSNKDSKERIAKSWGFSSAEDYQRYLELASGMKFKRRVSKIKPLDMMIAFDTTGSMNAYIEAVREHVRTLVTDLFTKSKDLRIGIVAFGDYCDMTSRHDFGPAYQVLQPTNNTNDIIDFINRAQSTSGGDADEFYEVVIKKLVEETTWRSNSQKSVLLIGDSEPHAIGYSFADKVKGNQIDWKEEAQKAKDAGVQFDTMLIHPDRKSVV